MSRVALILVLLALPLSALAQDDGGGIDVIDVSGPLDASALGFMADSIEAAAASGQELAVLQINSRAVLDGESFHRLTDLIVDPPLPVAVWIGPAPAKAYGGAALIAQVGDQSAISPGSEIGLFEPVVLGQRGAITDLQERIAAEESGLELQPSIRQYLQALDGRTFRTADGPVIVSTLEEIEGGVTVKEVTFRKPGFGIRFFRLAVTPEAAFFFFIVGLTLVAFEFFAIGPGVAAGVAAVSLILGGWGMVNLPTRPWAVGLAILGWALLTVSYQKGGIITFTALGAIMLQTAGMSFVEGSGQIDPRWWLVTPSVLAVLFFFLLAMPTVQRARFSTQTIGRESMVGHTGKAVVDFDPDGVVEVMGARWRATAHREAGLELGSDVIVTGVDGLFLEVDPVESGRET